MIPAIAQQRNVYTEIIEANSAVASANYMAWKKPSKIGWLHFLLIGGGGGGGAGAIGANSTAAGGGGGGSAAQSSLLIPAWLLPDILYILVGTGGAPNAAGITSRIMIYPDSTANHTLLAASGGNAGGNAAGATAGAAGTAGAVGTLSSSCLAGIGQATFLAGQAGIIGGVAVSGGNVTVPTTGLIVMGGAGGGGLPATATAGTAGGFVATVALPTKLYPSPSGGNGGSAATTPPTNGGDGYNNPNGITFSFGGAGGGSTHGSATGAGLVQSTGGAGGFGSGGGGSGGALTGSTAGTGGRGGNGRLYITGW